MRRGLIATGVWMSAMVIPSTAHANYADLFGWGIASISEAGTGAAVATDASAVFLNPAGLGAARRSSVSLGGTWLTSGLSVRGQPVSIPEAWGGAGGLAIVPGGDTWVARHLAAGLGFYVLPDAIIRITAQYPTSPAFPYYDNRTQRDVIIPALALRIAPGLSVGVGLNVFAGLGGPSSATDGPTRAVQASISESINTRASVLAGVRFSPTPAWTFGLVYRQRFDVPYVVTTTSLVGGVPLNINVSASGLFTPDELVAAIAWQGTRLGLTTEVRYSRWSEWNGPYVQVQATLMGLALAPPAVSPGFHDTVSVRIGAHYRIPYAGTQAVTLHAGAGYEPTIVGDQTGITNLLDNDRWIGSLGALIDLPPVWGVQFRVGIAGQVQWMADRTFVKQVGTPAEAARNPLVLADQDASLPGTQITNPGYPSISGGGAVYTLLWGVEIDL